MTRAILVHGWGSSSQGDWFPWVVRELRDRGYEVLVPDMPKSDIPGIDAWTHYLQEVIGEFQESDLLIGHSIGCQTILREITKEQKVVSKVILVAPWILLTNLENHEAERIAEPWLTTPIDWEACRARIHETVCIFSDNDPFVPLAENKEAFVRQLNAEVLVLPSMGHISGDDGVLQLPQILQLLP